MAISGSLAYAQPVQVSPTFDAASVRIRTPGNVEGSGGGPWIQNTPASVTMRNAKLVWCLGWAYDQKDWLISGPEWITSERYDIFAKTGRPVSVAQLKVMLQALLLDRFKLVMHHDTKEWSVSVLVPGKNGPKNLVPAAVTGPADGPRPLGGKPGPSALVYKSVSMSDFAERLGGPPPMGVGERVVDGTGVSGSFDITLKVDTANFVGSREEFADFLKSAIEEQFGLRIVRRKMPLDTLVIDQGSRVPAEN